MFPERSDRVERMLQYALLLSEISDKETVSARWAVDMIGKAFAHGFTAAVRICVEKQRVPTREEFQEEINKFGNSIFE